MEQKSSWSRNPISWGTSRVWLQPDANTNTYGRSGFKIHGGLTKGSAGCIDIPWQTEICLIYFNHKKPPAKGGFPLVGLTSQYTD